MGNKAKNNPNNKNRIWLNWKLGYIFLFLVLAIYDYVLYFEEEKPEGITFA